MSTPPPPPPPAGGQTSYRQPTAGMEPPLDQPYYGAPFGVAFVRFWKKGFTFTGRASRSEYWFAYLATVLVFVVLYVLASVFTAIGQSSYSSGTMVLGSLLVWVALIYALAILIPSLAIAWRRLHDTNKSGGMYFLGLIPFVGGLILLILLALESNSAGARFDVRPYGQTPQYPTYPPTGSVPPLAAPPVVSTPTAAAYPPPPPPAVTGQSSNAVVPPPPPPAPAPAARATAPEGVPPSRPAAQPAPPVVLPTSPAPVAPGLISGIPGVPAAPADPQGFAPITVLAASDQDLDSTRISAPLAAASWVVDMPDGRRLPVGAPLFFGRSPAAPEQPDAVLVPIDDPAKSMSKTHARIQLVGARVEVTDLHSTNGTKVTADGLSTVSLTPGVPQSVTGDASVAFGDYVVSLHRNN